MSKDLKVQQFSCEPEHFIAGADIPIAKSVKTAGEDIAAHAPVLIDAAGKLKNIATPAEGKAPTLTGLYGVAAEAAAADEPVVVYLTGEFFADALPLAEGVTAAAVEVPLRNLGIFLK